MFFRQNFGKNGKKKMTLLTNCMVLQVPRRCILSKSHSHCSSYQILLSTKYGTNFAKMTIWNKNFILVFYKNSAFWIILILALHFIRPNFDIRQQSKGCFLDAYLKSNEFGRNRYEKYIVAYHSEMAWELLR